MTTTYTSLQVPMMIPIKSAAITISTSIACEADQLSDLRKYFEVHSQLLALLSNDDIDELVNWFDGRAKSAFLTISTANAAAMQFAYTHDLLDEEETIDAALHDYLHGQASMPSDCLEELLEFLYDAQPVLTQLTDGSLSILLSNEQVGVSSHGVA